EEVAGPDPFRLGAKELGPCGAVPPGSRSDPSPAQDGADRGGAEADPELVELALDAQASPLGILPAHPDHEGPEFGVDGRTPRTPLPPVGPLPTHELAVPPKERLRSDEEGGPPLAREQPAGSREEDPIEPAQPGPLHAPAHHRE